MSQNMDRMIGLDFGSKTVGVAVSDGLGITAQGLEIIRRNAENKLRQTCARIEAIIDEYDVKKIVLGLPKHMNNSLGDRVEKTLAFKEMLERRTGLEVVTWDERLTTVEADRTMIEAGIRREHRKEYVDMLAAVYILQGYMDYCRMQEQKDKDVEEQSLEEKETVGQENWELRINGKDRISVTGFSGNGRFFCVGTNKN